MEFVLVAPLYFILLGGLFIVGDLTMNNVRRHMGDHFVTWVGGSRFCPVDENGYRTSEKVQSILKPLYDLSIGGAVDGVGFKVDCEDKASGDDELNYFMRFYMGRVRKLPVAMPDWARGMLSMEESLSGKDVVDEYATVTLEQKNYFRSYSFHRLALSGIDGGDPVVDQNSRSRLVPASSLVQSGYLGNVIAEGWASELDDDGRAPIPSRDALSPGSDVNHSRALGMFGE